MKVLKIVAKGLPLFKEKLEIPFYATQRVDFDNFGNLYSLAPHLHLNCANAFVGINASGKTSILKVILFALKLLRNEAINHIETKSILGDSPEVVFDLYFFSSKKEICKLTTHIVSYKNDDDSIYYKIEEESLYTKKCQSALTKKNLFEFSDIVPHLNRAEIRNVNNFLLDDVSIIVAYNKENQDTLDVFETMFLTNENALPLVQGDIPSEIIEFLDPSIESISFEKGNAKTPVVILKFKNLEEIRIDKQKDLLNYLSSGTIKGITIFLSVLYVLSKGGYLIIDEIENHFNKEIVATVLRFFMDSKLNPNGAVLVYSSHYPELLDEYKRSDSIFIMNNTNGIIAQNLSVLLKRNDIKKSDAFQSGHLGNTAPSYESYMKLKLFVKNFLGSKESESL